MADLQLSDDVRNAIANVVETTVGVSPTLEIRTGPKPATPASADTGILIATIPVPADWLTNASAGVKALQGTWTAVVVAPGVPGHFRLKASGGAVKAQGSITLAGGGGSMIANNLDPLVVGQNVSALAFTLTAGNA
jgi:hypothetical protein